ncbi:MAG: hypothetical protein ACRBBK_10425 [Paracoccaceae bacterium]
MSKRFENGYIALALTCVSLTFIIGYVCITFAFSEGYKSADNEHQSYYANRQAREKAYAECLERSLTIPIAVSCVNNSRDASREDERAEQDLNAQREMAQWAKGMLWATLIIGMGTIITTAIGVWFVKRTLDSTNLAVSETSKATAAMIEANQIMRDEQRPILAPKGEIVQPFGDTMGGQIPPQFDFAFVFRNFGKIPAKVIDAVVEVQRIEVAEGNDHLTGTIRLDDPRSLSQIYLNGQDFVTREKLVHVKDFLTHDHYVRIKVTYLQAIGDEPVGTYTVERWGHLRLEYEDGRIRMAGVFDVADVKTIVFVPDQDGLKMS